MVLRGHAMTIPIDGFQRSCLGVINDASLDLLAMAPTGSGKTAVALMAILQVRPMVRVQSQSWDMD